MTPTLLIALVAVAFIVAAVIALRWRSRQSHDGDLMELGVVSARWISEVRRDEPWGRT
jgi:hypothetical protein